MPNWAQEHRLENLWNQFPQQLVSEFQGGRFVSKIWLKTNQEIAESKQKNKLKNCLENCLKIKVVFLIYDQTRRRSDDVYGGSWNIRAKTSSARGGAFDDFLVIVSSVSLVLTSFQIFWYCKFSVPGYMVKFGRFCHLLVEIRSWLIDFCNC